MDTCTCIISWKKFNYYPTSVMLSDCFLRCIKACSNVIALAEADEVTECIVSEWKLPPWLQCEAAFSTIVFMTHRTSCDNVYSSLLPTVVGQFSVDKGSFCVL